MGKKKVGSKTKAARSKEGFIEDTKDGNHKDQEPRQGREEDVNNDEEAAQHDLLREKQKQVGLWSNDGSNSNEILEDPSSQEALLNPAVHEANHEKKADEETAPPLAGSMEEDGASNCRPLEHEASPEKPIHQRDGESNEERGEVEKEEEDEGPWELKKVLSLAELSSGCPIKCFTADCPLPAAVLYSSASNKKFTYYYCLDCQETDFEGWPAVEDLPIKTMTMEHQKLMLSKCSKYKNTAMPVFCESPVKQTKATMPTNPMTSPPPQLKDSNSGAAAVITPADGGKKKVKPSKAHLEMHRKWQDAAESMGGPDARIVLSKPDAKKIIYDYLYDAFRPCTITQIFEGLKATIPSPVLKACLDDMTLDKDTEAQFADSDEEEDEPKKANAKKSGKDKNDNISTNPEDSQYKASLSLKAGRGSNSTLYYVDYNKAKNGDGMGYEEKAKLAGELSVVETELETLQLSIKAMRNETAMLLTQPKNPELALRLAKEEEDLSSLKEAHEEASKLVVNEAHKNQIKRRVENFTNIWRKRRTLCMNFLMSMESWTEGSLTAKKCFAETGAPIELESDEAAAASAMEYAKNKKKTKQAGKKRSLAEANGIEPDENFVAVMVDKQGKRTRVYVGDDVNTSTAK